MSTHKPMSNELVVFNKKPWYSSLYEWADYVASTLNDHPLSAAPLNIGVLIVIKNLVQVLPSNMSPHTMNLAISVLWSAYNYVFSQYQVSFSFFSRLFLISYMNMNCISYVFRNVLSPTHAVAIYDIPTYSRFLSWINPHNIQLMISGVSTMYVSSAVERQPLAIEYKARLDTPYDFVKFVKEETVLTTISALCCTAFFQHIRNGITRPIDTRMQAIQPTNIADVAIRQSVLKSQANIAEALMLTVVENILHIALYGRTSIIEKPSVAILDVLEYWMVKSIANENTELYKNVGTTVALKLLIEILLHAVDLAEPNLLIVKK